MPATPQTVYIVDDDRDFRESLGWLLDSAGLTCRQFESAEAFLQAYAGGPGCLLLDVRMSGMSGLALLQELQRQGRVLPVIVITGHGDVAMAVQAMKHRAVDFIEKPFDDEALLKLVTATLVHSDRAFNQARRAELLLARWQSLSQREQQVAERVMTGLSNREIAAALAISVKTVEIHRSRVMRKMGANNLPELVAALPELTDAVPELAAGLSRLKTDVPAPGT
ncbi:response regulator transcription factor [Exilibacterium tricleocarpae]|uniref:Response regulator transcription factor n=2 Tax=Exilibacterium tricleocarpae TaxID=2591008 RepID=A0A545UA14_9GAMM|nr:response regulator transcription factor [Exilibacterium tricleocarpae]